MNNLIIVFSILCVLGSMSSCKGPIKKSDSPWYERVQK